MSQYKISVIVPAYNVENYLEKCLDHISNQTYQNIEIIVVNDGSTDGTEKVIENAVTRDDRIKYIFQQNSGVSAARNNGLDCATGEYVMFVDGDDWIDTDTCQTALEVAIQNDSDVVFWSYMREYPDSPQPTLLFGDTVLKWDESNIDQLFRRLVGLCGDELSRPQNINSLATVWGKLYKRNVIKNCRFVDLDIIGTEEDTLFNIEVFSNINKAVYLPQTMSHYRKDNVTSITHSYKDKLALQWVTLHTEIKKFLDENGYDEIYYQALSNRICLGLIGLGLNLVEDKKYSFSKKIKELKRILKMPHYREALKGLELKHLPLMWRVFYFCAKHRLVLLMHLMLFAMNILRSRM